MSTFKIGNYGNIMGRVLSAYQKPIPPITVCFIDSPYKFLPDTGSEIEPVFLPRSEKLWFVAESSRQRESFEDRERV